MKMRFIVKLAILLSISQVSFSQNVYRFIGNGSWQVASNWLSNAIPPATLAGGDSIIIDPSGECILDIIQTIADGAVLIVNPGKRFIILGDLIHNTGCSFTDPRDGQVYPCKTIGTQVWMAKNLNYDAPGSWCYDDNPANCAIYGRLYNWNTAIAAAPPGWHLPSDAEWTMLTTYLGGLDVAGGAMKSTSWLWASPNEGATNGSGFSGLPGGYRSVGVSYGLYNYGDWWSSTTASNANYAFCRFLYYSGADVFRTNYDKNFGFSVRCVKD